MSMKIAVIDQIKEIINNVQPEFNHALVDKSIVFKQQAVFAMQLMQNNSFLANVALDNKQSLKNAMVNVAALGLTLNPAMKLAYLVPRKVKGQMQICLDISYMGLTQLAYQSGLIIGIDTEIIYEGDYFKKTGPGNQPEFTPSDDLERENKPIVGVFCSAKTDKNAYITTHMSIAKVYEVRNTSEAWKAEDKRKYSPWVTWEDEMIKKTAIKRASKSWPKSDKSEILMNGIQLQNENGEGLSSNDAVNIDIEGPLSEIGRSTSKAVLQAIWNSVNKLLPAKSPERKQVSDAVKEKLILLQDVTDVEVKEPKEEEKQE